MADPLDLARWRALVSDTERVILTACADIIERQGDGAVRYIGARVDEVREPLTALTTALRAACDQVERLRAEVASWQRYKAQLDEAFNSGDGSYRP